MMCVCAYSYAYIHSYIHSYIYIVIFIFIYVIYYIYTYIQQYFHINQHPQLGGQSPRYRALGDEDEATKEPCERQGRWHPQGARQQRGEELAAPGTWLHGKFQGEKPMDSTKNVIYGYDTYIYIDEF